MALLYFCSLKQEWCRKNAIDIISDRHDLFHLVFETRILTMAFFNRTLSYCKRHE